MYSWQTFMCFHISNLANEWVRAIWSSPDDQLCHYNCMVCCASERTNPPFRGSQTRRVKDESLVLWIPGGSCLQSTNIRSMAQFSLCITSNCLIVLCRFEEEFVLFWRALVSECSLGELVNARVYFNSRYRNQDGPIWGLENTHQEHAHM